MIIWSIHDHDQTTKFELPDDAMNDLFSTHQDQSSGWGVLLVDAVNAFNSLNCTAKLLHACLLWPQDFFSTHG